MLGIDLSRESTVGTVEECPLVGQGEVEILDGPGVIRLVEPVVDRVRRPSQVTGDDYLAHIPVRHARLPGGPITGRVEPFHP